MPAGITRDGEKEEFLNEELCLEDLNLYAPGRELGVFSFSSSSAVPLLSTSPEVGGASGKSEGEAAQFRDFYSDWKTDMYA